MSAAPAGVPPHRGRPRPAAPVALLLGAVLLAGCSGRAATVGAADASSPTAPPATPPATPAATAPPAVPAGRVALSPLTGLPAAPGTETRPVVGVAVSTGTGRPAPVGLDRADLTYVAFPGPGRQRLLALFQSQDADQVGPVDDTRPLDNRLLSVTGGVLEHSGGTEGFVRRTDNADLPQWSAVVHPSSFTRDGAGRLVGSTAAARAAPGTRPAVEGLVPFRLGPELPTSPPAAVTVAVAGQPAVTLTYDGTAHTWSGTLGTLPLRAATVIVQQVAYDRLDLPDTPATEGDPVLFGSGGALVLTGPGMLDATWNRTTRGTLTGWVGTDGVPLRFAPGPSVVLLVPTGTPVTR